MSKTSLEVQKLSDTDIAALVSYLTEELQRRQTGERPGNSQESDYNETYAEPKKKAKKRKMASPPSIAVDNRYTPLCWEEEDEQQADSPQTEDEEDENVSETLPEGKCPDQSQTRTGPQGYRPEPLKKPKIVPIIVREKEKWTGINKKMQARKINYVKAKVVKTGIEIEPQTEQDYRDLYKLLKEQKIQFHTYELRSEKPLKIVIKGVPQEMEEQEIKEDLEAQSYPITKITRMKGKRGPMPMVLVEIGREYKSIYNQLKHCCGLAIQIEPLEKKSEIIQCHRCQLFGHIQKNCHANYRCMKCADNHSTHECNKPSTTPPKCANCGEAHLSISRRCKMNPNNENNHKKGKESEKKKENPWNKKEKIEKAQEEKCDENCSREFHQTLGKMVTQFIETNPTEQQEVAFMRQIKAMTELFNRNKQNQTKEDASR